MLLPIRIADHRNRLRVWKIIALRERAHNRRTHAHRFKIISRYEVRSRSLPLAHRFRPRPHIAAKLDLLRFESPRAIQTAAIAHAKNRKTPKKYRQCPVGGGSLVCVPSPELSLKSTSCAGSCTGSDSSSTASNSVKIAVFAPIPSASVSTATAVNPGFCSSTRNPKRISFSRLFTPPPFYSAHTTTTAT